MREDGIVEVRAKPMAVQTLEAAKEEMASIAKFAGDQGSVPVLVDVRNAKGIARDARNYYSDSEETQATCRRVALLIGSPVSMVMGTVMLGLSKPKAPLKLFTDEKAAIRWLKTPNSG